MQDEDWQNSWKAYYQPLPIGEKLMVVPSWLNPELDGRIPVRLDPGMIFGTGAHASTQMCMLALERVLRGGESVVDLGCGSGILAITALLLGADNAVGVDIDPLAPDIAKENAARNGLSEPRISFFCGDVLTDDALLRRLSPCDVLLANIVADVIIPLAPLAARMLRAGGRFLCSGILDRRLEEVQNALQSAGFTVQEVLAQEDWRSILAALPEAEH